MVFLMLFLKKQKFFSLPQAEENREKKTSTSSVLPKAHWLEIQNDGEHYEKAPASCAWTKPRQWLTPCTVH